jgi:tetratricopeptide (TPR) repeat protein
MVDRLRLPTSSAAFLFHFRPEALRHFTPVYQDSYFRVFRIHEADRTVPPPNPLPYEEIFDAAPLGEIGPLFDDRVAERAVGRLVARINRTQDGIDLVRANRRDAAAQVFREVLFASPDCVDALSQLALIAADAGRLDEARILVSRALATHAEYPELHTVRGVLLEREGRAEEAGAAYREALAIAPGYRAARRHLALLGQRP